MEIINWPLLKHPLNWLTCGLMVVFGGIVIHLVMSQITTPAANA